MRQSETVSYRDFLEELQKEANYHEYGGTSYRYKTARLSVDVAKRTGYVDLFFDKNMAGRLVAHLLQKEDWERVSDVTKLLHAVALDLKMNTHLSAEARKYVADKQKHRKQVSLIKH
ncbi:hypothetical protein [Lentibacillus juripiscarius]|uniref:Uncharacterized protein n=1 Tax=Lentibacillus juripiscarius TaxID=257446 RepID=A0ABW5V8T1_9BACI